MKKVATQKRLELNKEVLRLLSVEGMRLALGGTGNITCSCGDKTFCG